MNLRQGYDAKAFCKDAVSNWSSAESELLEWTEEIHNSISILAEGVRKQSIDANELPDSGFPEATFPLVKEFLRKFSIV